MIRFRFALAELRSDAARTRIWKLERLAFFWISILGFGAFIRCNL